MGHPGMMPGSSRMVSRVNRDQMIRAGNFRTFNDRREDRFESHHPFFNDQRFVGNRFVGNRFVFVDTFGFPFSYGYPYYGYYPYGYYGSYPYDYYGYRTYHERRQTYYGETPGSGGAKYGTGGATTQERYSGSTFAKGGGFKDSKYASKPGGYSSSKYASPGGDRQGQQFGRQASPPASKSFRPSPAPSRPSMPRSSPGRSFGRRR